MKIMNAVYTGDRIIVARLEHTEILETEISYETEVIKVPNSTANKRFGVVDLWKIHSGKRFANAYHHRNWRG